MNLDGFYYGRNFTKGFEQPFMEIRSQPAPADKVTETDLKMSHLSRQRWKWIWFDEWDRRVKAYTRNLKDSYYSYTIEGADHFSFCDIPLMTPFPNLLAPRLSRIHALTNEYTLAFFDQELRGIGSNLLQTRKKILQ